MTRVTKLAAGTCTHPSCERKAMRGWTVCPRHGTGGRRLFKGERAAARPTWIDARKTLPPPSKWPVRYLVILDTESTAPHCQNWAGRGEPEIAYFCSDWAYPWSARGSLRVAYWMPLPKAP